MNHMVGGLSTWGAAQAAVALHTSLRDSGVKGEIYAKRGFRESDFEVLSASSRVRYALNWRLASMGRKLFHKGVDNFNLGLEGINSLGQFLDADIIHLHWVSGLLSTWGGRSLRHKKIVWTLHDYSQVTGGCHVPAVSNEGAVYCNRFQTGCGNCPVLGSDLNWDVSRFIWYFKKFCLPKNIVFAVLNSDMKSELLSHEFLRGSRIEVMPNVVGGSGKLDCGKNKRKGQTEKFRIGFSCLRHSDSWKGYLMLVKALEACEFDDIELVTLGSADVDYEGFTGSIEHHGLVHERKRQEQILLSCDLFVAPYVRDTFGRTVVEALGLGLPVLGFNRFGVKEILGNGGGILVEPSIDGLVEGLRAYRKMSAKDRENLSVIAQKCAARYSEERVAKEYISLYESILI